MNDTVHEHVWTFLGGFNVQSYILDVCCYNLRVDLMCPKIYFYICVITIAWTISVVVVQKSFNEKTRSSFQEYCLYTLKFAADRV